MKDKCKSLKINKEETIYLNCFRNISLFFLTQVEVVATLITNQNEVSKQ